MYYRNLNNSLDFARDLLDNFNNLSYNPLNFFNSVLEHYFLSDNFSLLDFSLDMNYLNDFLNYLWHFNNSFNSLNDRHWFLNNSFYDFMLDLDMVDDLSCIQVFDNWYEFLDYFLYLDHLWNFDDSLYNFLNNNWNFDNSLNDSLHWDNLFLNQFHCFIFLLNVVYDSFNFHNSFNFNYFLLHSLNLNNGWNFSFNFNQSFNNSWYFDNSFDDVFNWNNFFDSPIVYNGLFERNIYEPIDFSDFLNFNYFFNDFFDSDNLRDLNNPFYNFLNYLFDFDNLWDDSENFQNVIDINDSHNFLSDHSNNSFIHFWD